LNLYKIPEYVTPAITKNDKMLIPNFNRDISFYNFINFLSIKWLLFPQKYSLSIISAANLTPPVAKAWVYSFYMF